MDHMITLFIDYMITLFMDHMIIFMQIASHSILKMIHKNQFIFPALFEMVNSIQ